MARHSELFVQEIHHPRNNRKIKENIVGTPEKCLLLLYFRGSYQESRALVHWSRNDSMLFVSRPIMTSDSLPMTLKRLSEFYRVSYWCRNE